MKFIYHLSQIKRSDKKLVGGKASALAVMAQEKLPVPKTICISTNAYEIFMNETELRSRVLMEYHRKPFDQMRWEEMWDCSLRIQNMFTRTPIPSSLIELLSSEIIHSLNKRPVAVRSSAIGEDSASASFAGLHESYLNVRGIEEILEHIKLVWASTWSDAAILYRKELVQGQKSGIIFGRSPVDQSKAVIEAVYGLNQGLVDGTIEPDRWMIDRKSGKIISHISAQRNKAVVTASSGLKIIKLTTDKRNKPPLTTHKVKAVFDLEKKLAKLFGSDQDVEWTYDFSGLRLLQSRPITTIAKNEKDDRKWYLSLRSSFDNLVSLRTKIENEIIPAMVSEAKSLKNIDLKRLNDEELAAEISCRIEICEKWKKQYWDFCIPFAHGVRLFGTVYNRTVKPENPYEFLELLAGTTLKSTKRNEKLQRFANKLKANKGIIELVRSGKLPKDLRFSDEVVALTEEFGTSLPGMINTPEAQARMLEFIIEIADNGDFKKQKKGRSKSSLEKKFLESMPKRKQAFTRQLIDLARASYRLRDDDNIYLGQIDRQLLDAVQEARNRSLAASKISLDISQADEVVKCLRNPNYQPERQKSELIQVYQDRGVIPRQLVGQPAGAGFATGRARIIRKTEDLFAFKKGEVLVCDAIDPNMTFVVPLASAIVERRGGMLIHGAIIAREYGLPCVTGVPDVVELIQNGQEIVVDGYLGIVTINKNISIN
jgi:pyruvate,water dikinase